jgi:hypothetical protein
MGHFNKNSNFTPKIFIFSLTELLNLNFKFLQFSSYISNQKCLIISIAHLSNFKGGWLLKEKFVQIFSEFGFLMDL